MVFLFLFAHPMFSYKIWLSEYAISVQLTSKYVYSEKLRSSFFSRLHNGRIYALPGLLLTSNTEYDYKLCVSFVISWDESLVSSYYISD
jgi:hypothetical protein